MPDLDAEGTALRAGDPDRDALAWEALRDLLYRGAFFTSHEGAPLRDRNGRQVPWLYHGSEVILSAPGLDLCTQVLSSRLRRFEGCQLATYGTSAIPLMARCLTAGHPGGIVIRKVRKQHGVARLLEGPVDRGRPVVVVDDSVSSGRSLEAAFTALEAEGLRVLGAVCLVEFSGYGARESLTSRGYEIDTVYDVWRDLGRVGSQTARDEGHAAPWSECQVMSGMSPATGARQVAEALLTTGRLLQPPDSFDREYDASGGTFVSIRRRADDVRLGRGGVRRDSADADPRHDLVLATERAVGEAGLRTVSELGSLKFAVACLGEAKPVSLRELEPARLALTVRGIGPLARSGFALPGAPQFADELQQLAYARGFSGGFGGLEPSEHFTHTVERAVEPDTSWPVDGAPAPDDGWANNPELAAALAGVLRHTLTGRRTAAPVPHPVPEPGEPVSLVAVSLYSDGLVGCGTSDAPALGAAVRAATLAAASDHRYGQTTELPGGETTAVVSLLVQPRVLGTLRPGRLPLFFRLGRDTLRAAATHGSGLVLAHFAAQQSIDEDAYRRQVLLKAGITDQPATWTAYDTHAWVVTSTRQTRLELGYPDRRPQMGNPDADPLPRSPRELAEQVAGFIRGQQHEDGLPAYSWSPWWDATCENGTAARVLIAATALAEAAPLLGDEVNEAAAAIADRFTQDGRLQPPPSRLSWDVAAEAQLVQLLTALEPTPDRRRVVGALTGRLCELVHDDGAVYGGAGRMRADLDLLSGSALLAMARAQVWDDTALEGVDLTRVLEFAQRRFRGAHPWGMVWWHALAWAALARSAQASQVERTARADLVWELLDWALDRQSRISGAFMTHGLAPARLSFLSACVLEGVAEGWLLAQERGEHRRAERYGAAWHDGTAFVDRLTLHADDIYFCPRPEAAVGGVRAVLPSSELRVDVAGHTLRALSRGLSADQASLRTPGSAPPARGPAALAPGSPG